MLNLSKAGARLGEIVGNIFHTEQKEQDQKEKKAAEVQQKINNMYLAKANTTPTSYNPFMKENGDLVNPGLNYQKLLNNSKISQTAKNYISQATGLSPTMNPQATTPSTNTKSGSSLTSAAYKYFGTPYVWGGESMDEGGMDCSGFIYAALNEAGYEVPRLTAQGYRQYGTKVSKEELQPGDLVFFGSPNNATHIGMYYGDGKIIHSAGGSKNTRYNPGKGVSFQDLNYRGDFIEGRRM